MPVTEAPKLGEKLEGSLDRPLALAGPQAPECGHVKVVLDRQLLDDAPALRDVGDATAGDVVDRVPRLQTVSGHFKQLLRNKLVQHKQYIREFGEDMPEIRDWAWPY